MQALNTSITTFVTSAGVLIGGASALAFLYAGFLFIFAGDDAQQAKSAKKAMGYAVLGAAIAGSAVALGMGVAGTFVHP